MPAFPAAASSTRIPSGTTPRPIPSPGIAAIRYFFIWPREEIPKSFLHRNGPVVRVLSLKKQFGVHGTIYSVKRSNVEVPLHIYAVSYRSPYFRRHSNAARAWEIDGQAPYPDPAAPCQFAPAGIEPEISAGRPG